ncbi:MAG: hypothetical protein RIC12_00620 [Pirellulales bacterium]
MKRIAPQRQTFVGAVVITSVLASLVLLSTNCASAQVSLRIGGGSYYSPFGQGPYGIAGRGYYPGYNQGYNVPVYPGSGIYRQRAYYAYPGYTSGLNRNVYGYGGSSYLRYYGRPTSSRRSYSPTYVPFGYRPF